MKYLVILVVLLSCAKQRDYKEIFKEGELIDRNLISSMDNPNSLTGVTTYNQGDPDFEAEVGDNVYLYIPTLEQGGYYNSKATSYFVGTEKMVTFKFEKDALRVNAIEKDSRFSNDEVNKKPILEIPLTYKDYKCRENADDECSQQEEENKDIGWENKKYAELNFGGIKIFETNTLPIELSNLFFPCYQEIDKKVSSWNITKDEVHIVIDKLFKTNILCTSIQTIEDLEKTTFSLKHHYQFKKLNSIASKDFKSIPYYKSDQDKFGFFTTESKKLSADNREVYYSRKVMMNRFDASRKEIPFFVSQNLLNSKNSDILKATEEVFDIINESLEMAQTPMRLKLEKTAREKNLHKLQNSIIMVEEPLAGGLLGYGPSITNPMTGEILQAQTVMYSGNHIKFIRRTYDELISKHIAALEAKKVKDNAKTENSSGVTSRTESIMLTDSWRQFDEEVFERNMNFQESLQINQVARSFDLLKEESYLKTSASKLGLIEKFKMSANQVDVSDILSKHNMLQRDYIDLSKMMSQIIKDTEMTEDQLKPWVALSDKERESIISVLLPQIWKQVLLHEIGHNLGLRHNFAGSEDKANFYSKEELAQLGIDHEIPYSSVMDYGHSDLNSLPIMGKYDIAALKFAYARKVETKDGTDIDLGKSIALLDPEVASTLKTYKFCTDEQVYLSPTCNRFDEGTSTLEIVDHYIKNYYKSYAMVNTKQDRLSFSSLHSMRSVRRKYQRTFFPLRKFFDQYEMIHKYVQDGRIDPNDPFVKENQLAVMKIANFLMSVVDEHDAMCKFFDIQTNQSIWAPLKDLNYTACAQIPPIANRYVAFAQTGVVQQDLKSITNPSAYVSEIDVRGAWVDKFLALHVLSMKEHGIKAFDQHTDNFLSLKIPFNNKGETVDKGVKRVMDQLINGTHTKKAIVIGFNGSISEEEMKINSSESDFILRSESSVFNRIMDTRKGKNHLSKILLNVLIENNDSIESTYSKPLVAPFIATTSARIGDTCHSTKYGDVCFSEKSKKIKEIIEKSQISEKLIGKNASYASIIAKGLNESKAKEEIMLNLDNNLNVQAKALYEANKDIFKTLAEASKSDVDAVLAGKPEEVESQELKELLIALPKELLIVKSSNANLSDAQLANNYIRAISEPIESYAQVIDDLKDTSRGVLETIGSNDLNSKDHYEKILSSLAF